MSSYSQVSSDSPESRANMDEVVHEFVRAGRASLKKSQSMQDSNELTFLTPTSPGLKRILQSLGVPPEEKVAQQGKTFILFRDNQLSYIFEAKKV